ncbi:MAG: M56 family metallopeptidase [bacterium]|nr:M56 family metallopeptidase [bacterium]
MIGQFSQVLGPVASVTTKVLLHSIWQGGLVALLLAAALAFIRHSDTRVRYAVSCLSLVLMVGLSIATGYYIAGSGRAPTAIEYEASGSSATTLAQEASTSETIAASEASPSATGLSLQSLQWLVFPGWAAGVLILSLYHLVGWRKVRGLTRRGTQPVSEAWKERFERLRTAAGLDRAVDIAGSSLARVPCVVGWIKPVILIPLGSFSGLTVEELEMIILHELAHIRRHDVLVGYVQAIAEILLFFNPAVWWVSRKIRIEREHCCDDLAIELSGNRLGYARALAALAESRIGRTSLVAAADGTPLLERVRRIMGVPSRQAQPSRGSLGGALLLAGLLLLSFTAFGGSTYSDTKPATVLESSNPVEPERGDIRGEWEIESQGRSAQVRTRFGRNRETGFSVRTRKFLEQVDLAGTNYKLQRDAGTFYFEGRFEQDGDEFWGSGDCFFRADPAYVEAMDHLGYSLDDEDVLTLAIHNVKLDWVKGLDQLGYDDLSFNELLEAHIHDVTPEYIDDLQELGYDNLRMSKLVEMQIHDVEAEYIRELNRLGYDRLSPSRLVEMCIHDVETEYIEEMAELGYYHLSPSQLVEMQIHDVDVDFVRELGELGYDDLSRSKLVEFQIHDVTPSFIRGFAELGYQNLKPSKLVEFSIHDVTPRYIRQLAELGYEDISPSRLVEMQIHDVTPSFIKKMQRRGYDDLSPRDLVDLKIHGR